MKKALFDNCFKHSVCLVALWNSGFDVGSWRISAFSAEEKRFSCKIL
jgi:hypothetical protein